MALVGMTPLRPLQHLCTMALRLHFHQFCQSDSTRERCQLRTWAFWSYELHASVLNDAICLFCHSLSCRCVAQLPDRGYGTFFKQLVGVLPVAGYFSISHCSINHTLPLAALRTWVAHISVAQLKLSAIMNEYPGVTHKICTTRVAGIIVH